MYYMRYVVGNCCFAYSFSFPSSSGCVSPIFFWQLPCSSLSLYPSWRADPHSWLRDGHEWNHQWMKVQQQSALHHWPRNEHMAVNPRIWVRLLEKHLCLPSEIAKLVKHAWRFEDANGPLDATWICLRTQLVRGKQAQTGVRQVTKDNLGPAKAGNELINFPLCFL